MVKLIRTQTLGPSNSRTHMRQFGFHVGGDAGMELAVVVEDTQGVFAHLLCGKEFRGSDGEVEAQLHAKAEELVEILVV